MENLVYLAMCIALLATIIGISRKRVPDAERRDTPYRYILKQHVMTGAEARLYKELQRTLPEGQYIVPQAHLSMFLDHRVKGQDWRAAFSKINGKSVDFLIVESETNRPILAIELDDTTHERDDRMARDQFVETILHEAGIPLKRM